MEERLGIPSKYSFEDEEAKRAQTIFSTNLRRYMELKNINVKELAAAIKVPYGTVNDWYNAKKYPRIGKMERLAKYFNIRKSDLIEDNESVPNGEDEELWDLREKIRQRPELKILFDLSQKATNAEVEAAIQMFAVLTKDKE